MYNPSDIRAGGRIYLSHNGCLLAEEFIPRNFVIRRYLAVCIAVTA